MSKINKECFFLIYLEKPKSDSNDEMNFTSPKEDCPKCIRTIEDKEHIIKIFKFSRKLIRDNTVSFEFSYDQKNYKMTIENINEKTFLFSIDLFQIKSKYILNIVYSKIDQSKIGLPEKMNYFYDAIRKENDKIDILLSDSINLCSKRPSFHFLISIFVGVCNTTMCTNLLEVFEKYIDFLHIKDNINKEQLLQYKLTSRKYVKRLKKLFQNIR